MKSFGIFLVKSTSECYFWLANKVSTDSNKYFLKFSWKVFRISFRPKKSLLGHFWFKLKYWKVLEIFWFKVHQNAISELQTKFQLILTSTFWNFHEKSLETVLCQKSHFWATFDSNFKILKSFGNFLVKSTSECYFWIANKVSTDSNEYFLKFSWKVFRNSFRPKKSLLGHFWFKLWNIEKFSKFLGQKYIRMLFLTCKQSFNWF